MEATMVVGRIGGKEINFRQDERGEFWFPGEEIGKVLDYAHPRERIDGLFQRNRDILGRPEYTSVLKLSTEAGEREIRVYSEEGVYLLLMYSKQPKARECQVEIARDLKRRRIERQAALEGALAERDQKLAQMEIALAPDHKELYHEWIEARSDARIAQKKVEQLTQENRMCWAAVEGAHMGDPEYWQWAWVNRIAREAHLNVKGIDWTPGRRVMRIAFDLKRH